MRKPARQDATKQKDEALAGQSGSPRDAKQPYASEVEDYQTGQPEKSEDEKRDAAEKAGKPFSRKPFSGKPRSDKSRAGRP